MQIDRVPSYFDGIEIRVRRKIPTFSEACQAQMDNPELFDTHIYTKTFVAFGPKDTFKMCDGHPYAEPPIISQREITEGGGFIRLTNRDFNEIKGKEFYVGLGGSCEIVGPKAFAENNPILRRLIGESRIEAYLHAKQEGMDEEFKRRIPLVYIRKAKHTIGSYLAPIRLGTKRYYIATGEDPFIGSNTTPEYHFLRQVKDF